MKRIILFSHPFTINVCANYPTSEEEANKILHLYGKNINEVMNFLVPNTQGLAYLALKRISSLRFGERDIATWEKWVKSNYN